MDKNLQFLEELTKLSKQGKIFNFTGKKLETEDSYFCSKPLVQNSKVKKQLKVISKVESSRVKEEMVLFSTLAALGKYVL
jgi:hypothetical protein